MAGEVKLTKAEIVDGVIGLFPGAEVPSGVRLSCCVPFCRRTKAAKSEVIELDVAVIDLADEWICATHWRAVPARLRRLHSAAKRRLRRRRTVRFALVVSRIWDKCQRAAIEAAGGIG